MRILYLINTTKSSLKSFADNLRTNIPWVDAMLDEVIKYKHITIGLALPIRDNTFQKEVRNDITLYGIPNRISINRLLKLYKRVTNSLENPEIINFANKAVVDFEPDIIQIFGTENPFGLLLFKTKKPVVIHFQGSLQVVLEKWFSGFSKWDQFRYASIKDLMFSRTNFNEYFSFKKRAAREEMIIRNCQYFIGRTVFDQRLISFLSPGACYFNCEEFIRKPFFTNKWDVPLKKPITCISILKGVTYKGIDLLVRTSELILRNHKYEVEFRICGIEEDEEIINILKRKFRKRTDLSRIRFLGRLDTNGLIRELTGSNLFIHPSYIENSSNSICEAMALGMPVIATNVGGTGSLIEDGVDGLLVQEGEPFALASAIDHLTKNYDYARLLGQKARERALTRHNENGLYGRLIDIYRSILKDHHE